MKKSFTKKIKRVLAISMALSMVLCTNAFATPIDLANSTESVATDTLTKTEGTDYFADEDTNVWTEGEIVEETRVTVQRGSEFTVTIPKDIVLDGETGTADYIVNAKGDIAGDQVLKVVPDAEFEMTEAGGKDSVIATVTQNDTEYTYDLMTDDGTDYPGSVAAILTAGEWAGKFVFNISFDGGEQSSSELPEVKATLNDYTWAEIDAISKSGEAQTTYGLKVGDEKSVQIGEETYTLQIMGFNHDDLADGSGKAGITFGLKEIMTTKVKMNDTNTNVGGWEGSKMYNYLNNEDDANSIYNQLPEDLRSVIKTVSKKTSEGNMSTEIITSEDKLFLFSEVEIFGTTTRSASGEGEQYQYYTNGGSKIKSYLSGSSDYWWERSPIVNYTNGFCSVSYGGYANNYGANSTLGVVFGLSI